MTETLITSQYFGFVISIFLYLIAVQIKAKLKLPVFNPLLLTCIMVIGLLLILNIPYTDYKESADLLSYLLTPATVCLAIPMYRQLKLLRQNLPAILSSVLIGSMGSIVTILIMGKLLQLESQHIITLLPKSITTAIGMGVSEEAGGIVTLTVISIVITGIFGTIIAEPLFKLLKISHPIARGLALGTASHAIGTAKALEFGEIEGAMSSLSIVLAGVITVCAVPVVSSLFL
ncbi:MAG: LrgB family protein [Eubacteriales bacterium]|nr:LrgB family protein [Eubacteriales bacterium]